MRFYNHSINEVLSELNTTRSGLSSKQISQLKKQHGANVIQVGKVPLWKKIIEPFLDIFTLVLAAAAVISFWQGESLDGTIILVIIAISAIIYYVQRFSTERVLRTLNKKTIDKVTVLRHGQKLKVATPELVPGDIVLLTEGEKVPADIRTIDVENLKVDESILTGESLPMDKNTAALKGEKPIYEQSNILFSGSFVVSGTGMGVVTATGNNTQFGNIATLAKRTEAKSPVQKKIDQLITKIIIITGAVSVATFVLALIRGMELGESLRFVIALAVSAIPEGLPIAISVILVLGMRRMASKKALVQQMRAIETLGVITTIATDKTGTLTKNQLTVGDTWQASKSTDIKDAIAKAINQSGNLSDPLDKALIEYARKQGLLEKQSQPADELPFDQKYAMSATIWHSGSEVLTYVKGAPEAIMRHSKLTPAAKKAAQAALDELTSQGYRVIGLAKANTKSIAKDFTELVGSKIEFQGFVAVADTLRREASGAIKTALAAGVSVRMITGDHAETAFQIGKDLGMVETRDEVFDCRAMDKLSDDQVLPIINKTRVFARVIPEQKYRLLTLLKKRNITAMTGDGVNDVPALTNAHIGVAMGSGASIAKDAGDIVLLDDNFKTIIDAMREGRVIISNIRRMLVYLLATNAGEVLSMLGALIIGTRLPLEPVQILWVNLVTDTSMVIPLGLEPAENDVMKRKPQKPNTPILSRAMVIRAVITALAIASLTLVTYIIFERSHGHAYAQTMAFAALIVSQWGNAFAVRSHTSYAWARLKVMSRSFYIGLGISIVLQALVFFGPLGEALHVAKVDNLHLVIVSVISLLTPIILSDLHKAFMRRST